MKSLKVRVNEELTLDVGWCEEVRWDDGTIRRQIHPPQTTMFEQLLDYLKSLPPSADYPGIRLGQEAVAAAALCLRWGSYLAVLADRDKPLWQATGQVGVSRIADTEMARINVESSAALAQWIDLMRADYEGYLALMWTAVRYLPMPRQSARRDRASPLLALAHPAGAAQVVSLARPDQRTRARAEAEAHPTRILANAIINSCWRNGPIEDIHAGRSSTYPLGQRRITPLEERDLLHTTTSRLAQAILTVSALIDESDERSWPERVLPFNLASGLLVTPFGWSLHERTRPAWLPYAEPSG